MLMWNHSWSIKRQHINLPHCVPSVFCIFIEEEFLVEYILLYSNRSRPRSCQCISTSHLDFIMSFWSGNVTPGCFHSSLEGCTEGLVGRFTGWAGRDGTCSLQNGSIGSVRYLLHRSLHRNFADAELLEGFGFYTVIRSLHYTSF